MSLTLAVNRSFTCLLFLADNRRGKGAGVSFYLTSKKHLFHFLFIYYLDILCLLILWKVSILTVEQLMIEFLAGKNLLLTAGQ